MTKGKKSHIMAYAKSEAEEEYPAKAAFREGTDGASPRAPREKVASKLRP